MQSERKENGILSKTFYQNILDSDEHIFKKKEQEIKPIQKSVAFLYTNYEHAVTRIRNTILLARRNESD